MPSLAALTDAERDGLADVVRRLTARYDHLFDVSFPYSAGLHQAPTDGGGHEPVSHLHLEFTPLHRSADKLKYLAGSELGAGAFINDVAPEDAAGRLRDAVDRA